MIAYPLSNGYAISTECSIYTHSVDPQAIGRVIVKTLLFNNKGSGGGSTISQQLAKLLVGRPDFEMQVKLSEWSYFSQLNSKNG